MTRRLRTMICGSALTFLAAGTPALAEPAEGAGGLPQWTLRAQQRLALRPAQQRELRVLIDDNAMRLEALRELDSREALRERMAAVQREFRAGLARILSEGQLAEWDALLEELLGEVHLRNTGLLAATPRAH